jgi:hypothetical protein
MIRAWMSSLAPCKAMAAAEQQPPCGRQPLCRALLLAVQAVVPAAASAPVAYTQVVPNVFLFWQQSHALCACCWSVVMHQGWTD